MRQAQQNRQARVIRAAQSVLQNLGVHQTDSAPPSIQHYHHTHRDQFETRGDCYSHLGARPWGRAAKVRWSAKDVVWKLILEGLCRSTRLYTHREIGERVLSRAKALELSEERTASLGIKDLSARSVRYRLQKYGLRSLKTGPKNSPKSDNSSQEGSKNKSTFELRSKNQEKNSTVEPTSSSSSPSHSSTEGKNNIVSVPKSFSEPEKEPELVKGPDFEGNTWWWGRFTHTQKLDRMKIIEEGGPDWDCYRAVVYGMARVGHVVRCKVKGKAQDFEITDTLYYTLHEGNQRDLTIVDVKKIETRHGRPLSWDRTWSMLYRFKTPAFYTGVLKPYRNGDDWQACIPGHGVKVGDEIYGIGWRAWTQGFGYHMESTGDDFRRVRVTHILRRTTTENYPYVADGLLVTMAKTQMVGNGSWHQRGLPTRSKLCRSFRNYTHWEKDHDRPGDQVPEKAPKPVGLTMIPTGKIWKDVEFPDMENYGYAKRDQFMAAYRRAMSQSRNAPWTGKVLGDVQVGGLFYGWSDESASYEGVMEVNEVLGRCRDRQGRKVTKVKARESRKSIAEKRNYIPTPPS